MIMGELKSKVDLKSLEESLVQIGEDDGEELLSSFLERTNTPALAHFIRGLVGFDRQAALRAFPRFTTDESLTPSQMRFSRECQVLGGKGSLGYLAQWTSYLNP